MKQIIGFIHSLVVPKEENNFRARALHPDFLTYYLIAALIATIIFKVLPTGTGSVLGYATDITVEKLFSLTNAERSKNNVSPLSYNQELADAAAQKAQDMFAKNYWAHYSPEGATPWDFIHKAGYQYEYAGENLAKNFMFSQGVVDAWMNSPTHRENMVRKDYTEVGFAIVNGVLNGEQTTLVVQMFGKPLSSTVQADTVPEQAPRAQAALQEAPQTAATQPNKAINPSVLANASQTKPFFFPLYFNMNMIFLGFLLLALVLDIHYAMKHNIIRVSGKNLAHLMFIGFIFAGLLFIAVKGAIL